MPSKTIPQFLTRKEVADRLGVTTKTIWVWTRDGKLPDPYRFGKTVRYRKRDLDEALAAARND